MDNKTTIRAGYGIFAYSSNYFWEGQGARGTWPYAIADTLEGLNGPTTLPGRWIVPTETMYAPHYNFPRPRNAPQMHSTPWGGTTRRLTANSGTSACSANWPTT